MRRRLADAVERRHAVLGGIVLVALVVRAYGLGAESLWIDEIFTAGVVENRGLAEIVLELPEEDPHPPLYYVVLSLWTELFGTSAVGLRSLSVALDLASIPILYTLGTRLFDRRTGLVAAGLFTLSPFFVWYGREARMYALLAFLGLASFYCLVVLWRGDARWWRGRAAYAVATIGLCLTHALAPLVVVAQNVYVGAGVFGDGDVSREVTLNQWLPLQVLIGVVVAPYYFVLFVQTFVTGTLAGYVAWLPEASPTTLWFIAGSYVGRAIPPSSPDGRHSLWDLGGLDLWVVGELVTLAALALAAYAVVSHVRSREPADSPAAVPFLVTWIAVPLALMYVLSVAVQPVLFDRYTAVVGAGLLLLVARGVTALPRTRRQTAATLAVVALVLTVPVVGLHTEPQKQQWAEATATVEADAASGDLVVVDPFWAADGYQHYAEREDLRMEGIREDAGQFGSVTSGQAVVWVLLLEPDEENRPALKAAARGAGFEIDRNETYTGIEVYRFVRSG